MREPFEVLVSPVVTEKSTRQTDEENVYTFIVACDANKHEIGRAVAKIWDVDVVDVRTVNYRGKLRRSLMGRMSQNSNIGRSPSFKKAYVTLAEGHHIEFYEVG